ncbi:Transmembrane protein [Trema orientale]|uniref:Transmembrane protein n=1 Tax=Trema orientale TaxID=63057 RepID=A0A2P5FPU2_TREOI|nr:Transmembrane protein [Trema orientale]
MLHTRLFEASLSGDVEALHQLIKENPLILADYALVSPHENPLHIAIKAGKLGFVKEMLRLKPNLVRELNKDGFRPLDIASALGRVEIVKELITSCTTTTSICRLKGRDGRTALHYAAMSGKLDVMDELISSSKECVKDLTALGETALHLALKYYKFQAFRNLIEWLPKLGLEEIVNWGDKDGNTVLHLAVARKQHEIVELLLSRTKPELNARNSRGLTAMDIVDILIMDNPSDFQLKETLQYAGVLNGSAQDHNSSSSEITISNMSQEADHDQRDWIEYFRYQRKRDSPSDTRNALLVVATLIATVTFQAGVNPPSSFSITKSNNTQTNSATTTRKDGANVPYGYTLVDVHDTIAPSPVSPVMMPTPWTVVGFGAVLANLSTLAASEMFLFGNSLGLAASLNVIIYLTAGFPFQRELHISIYSMMFAYGWCLQDLEAEKLLRNVILGFAFLLPFSLRWFPRWAKRIPTWWINKLTMMNSRVEHYPTL